MESVMNRWAKHCLSLKSIPNFIKKSWNFIINNHGSETSGFRPPSSTSEKIHPKIYILTWKTFTFQTSSAVLVSNLCRFFISEYLLKFSKNFRKLVFLFVFFFFCIFPLFIFDFCFLIENLLEGEVLIEKKTQSFWNHKAQKAAQWRHIACC